MGAANLAMQIVLDIVESIAVTISLVLLAPFLVLRFSAKNSWHLIQHLLPQGVLASFLRAKLSQRLGNHQGAALIFDQIIRVFERGFTPLGSEAEEVEEILMTLYKELLGSYLRLGQFDHASSLVLRANGFIGSDGIEGYPELCVQSAHIVKAGLAAGRLLDEGGLKDLFQSGKPVVVRTSTVPTEIPDNTVSPAPVPKEGKVLPFIRPEPTAP